MKNKRGIISYILPLMAIIAIVVLPDVLMRHNSLETKKIFYERLEENHEVCRERFKEDGIPNTICIEISKNAREAFNSASEAHNDHSLLLRAMIFGFGLGILGLKRQIDELKEKTET